MHIIKSKTFENSTRSRHFPLDPALPNSFLNISALSCYRSSTCIMELKMSVSSFLISTNKYRKDDVHTTKKNNGNNSCKDKHLARACVLVVFSFLFMVFFSLNDQFPFSVSSRIIDKIFNKNKKPCQYRIVEYV